MANLLSSLLSSSNALNAYEQVLAVTQNNVANASTPGYAKQTLPLEAMSFDLVSGSMGGVRAGQVLSARDQYAEQAVRRQTASEGYSQQSVGSLQSLFDVSGSSGISAALNQMFQSFSPWGQSPSDTNARQSVIDSAGDVATAFQRTASGLAGLEQDTQGQLQQTVSQVNSLVGQLQQLNIDRLGNATSDPGTDARMNSLLEQLSQYVDFDASYQSDGSVAILLNGETPLLLGDKQYSLAYQPDQGPPAARILAADGTDVTAASTGGQLGALLQMRNQILPS
jgi:flagellar hook-associated protein 1